MPEPFEITEHDGVKYGTGNGLVVTMDTEGHMFRRRAIKGIGGTPYRAEWLVIDLGEHKIYVTEGHVVVTDKEMMP